MLLENLAFLAVLVAGALADVDPWEKYTICAPGINASFIAYGARLTNLFVKDKDGHPQDVVLGFDDGKGYLKNDQDRREVGKTSLKKWRLRLCSSLAQLSVGTQIESRMALSAFRG